MRQKITWLFVAFFAVVSSLFFVEFLIDTGIITLNVILLFLFSFLVSATIVAIIGIVMLGVKPLYMLPLFVAILATFHYIILSSNYTQTVNLIQDFTYVYTGQFIGNPWFIILKTIFPNIAPSSQLTAIILNSLFDPLSRIVPNPSTSILGLYLAAIVIPTTVLFYILAWKNRSGRSLGFALGLTTDIIWGFVTLGPPLAPSQLSQLVLALIATIFYALGIFGVFNRLMKREERPKQQMEKEKT
jgi:hypothetical protein